MYKQFTVTKNKFKKDGSNEPDYRMNIRIGEEFVETASLWTKEDKNGQKFFSGSMNDVWVDHTKNIFKKGFVIIEDTKESLSPSPQKEIKSSEIPF